MKLDNINNWGVNGEAVNYAMTHSLRLCTAGFLGPSRQPIQALRSIRLFLIFLSVFLSVFLRSFLMSFRMQPLTNSRGPLCQINLKKSYIRRLLPTLALTSSFLLHLIWRLYGLFSQTMHMRILLACHLWKEWFLPHTARESHTLPYWSQWGPNRDANCVSLAASQGVNLYQDLTYRPRETRSWDVCAVQDGTSPEGGTAWWRKSRKAMVYTTWSTRPLRDPIVTPQTQKLEWN